MKYDCRKDDPSTWADVAAVLLDGLPVDLMFIVALDTAEGWLEYERPDLIYTKGTMHIVDGGPFRRIGNVDVLLFVGRK